jgi:hypothetical protein
MQHFTSITFSGVESPEIHQQLLRSLLVPRIYLTLSEVLTSESGAAQQHF